MRGALLVSTLIACLLAPASGAAAAPEGRRQVHDVRPGPNAIQRAVDRAEAGDILRIHSGRYRETVEVDKALTLRGVGKRIPVIDGRCKAAVVLNVLASGVTLSRLRVQGATDLSDLSGWEVNFAGVSDGVAKRMVFRDTCDAEYGINVYATGHIVVSRSVARGFSDAGIYVGEIETGPVIVRRNEATDNNRGVIVEDSLPGTVRVEDNRVFGNDQPGTSPEASGIDLIRTDGVDVLRNEVTGNLVFGIRAWADPMDHSTGNRIYDNRVSGSGKTDLRDEPDANCWNGTTYGTADPFPPNVC